MAVEVAVTVPNKLENRRAGRIRPSACRVDLVGNDNDDVDVDNGEK